MDKNSEEFFEDACLLPHPHIPKIVESSSSVKEFNCPKCKISFCDEKDLFLHASTGFNIEYTSIQYGGTLYLCPCCEFEFSSFKGMRQHFGKLHSNVKAEKCIICLKFFKDKHAVRFHIAQVHEKVTQKSCEFCMKVCYNKYAYRMHLNKCIRRAA